MGHRLEKITDEKIVKLFEGRSFAFLATVNKDGSPQVTPTWIDRDNEFILVNTAMGRVKLRNVSRDPRVSISMVDEQNPYSMVTISGKVTEQIYKGADEHIDRLAKRYLDVESYPSHSPEVKRVILRIKPEKIFFVPPRYQRYVSKRKS
ncbi:MAG: PPOX class F420-dependent oxidoreductase [Thermoproteota archaeon]|jgi:PPOX class probable F420-dependent enzyme|nr:PPOX class F420-dependent oxidoreductase [Thermoproteota archaeon]